ncbi:mucin-binding protein [Weissella minor]|uniref:mucin-binding protein n=1 Tax=Weissella minor TaxID=1620 RepID=UPI003AF2A6AC
MPKKRETKQLIDNISRKKTVIATAAAVGTIMVLAPQAIHAESVNSASDTNYAPVGSEAPSPQLAVVNGSIIKAEGKDMKADAIKKFGLTRMEFIDANADNKSRGNMNYGLNMDYVIKGGAKKGQQFLVPLTASGESQTSDGLPRLFSSSRAQDENVKLIGNSKDGIILEAKKAIQGDLKGTINIGATTGAAGLAFRYQLNEDLTAAKPMPIYINYDGEKYYTATADIVKNPIDVGGLLTSGNVNSSRGNMVNTPVYMNGAQYLNEANSKKSSKELNANNLTQVLDIDVKSNDTIISKSKNPSYLIGYMKMSADDGFKVFNIGTNVVMPDGKTTFQGQFISNLTLSTEYYKGIQVVDIPDGTSKAEAIKMVEDVQKKHPTKPAFGQVIKKGNKGGSVVVAWGDFQVTGPKLKDFDEYKKSDAKDPASFLQGKTGITLTKEQREAINYKYTKWPLDVSFYSNFYFENGAEDHHIKGTYETFNEGKTIKAYDIDETIRGQKAASKGQSSVVTRYLDADTGKALAEASQPVYGYPKGSDENKDGSKKATVTGKYFAGYALVKKPAGATTTAPYKATVDFPAEGTQAAAKYEYRKVGKFVTDEAKAKDKMPDYKVNAKEFEKIESSYTIPYVAGKKAQIDGKDLPLKDAKDKAGGYTASPQDMFKDTKVTYVNDDATLKVVYRDMTDGGKELSADNVKGSVTEKSGYTTDAKIKDYGSKGLKLVKDNVPKNHVYTGAETYYVDFAHKTTVHTPGDPKGMSLDLLKKNVSQEIDYKNGKTGQAMEGMPAHKQSVEYTKTITTDDYTKKEISATNWVSKDPKFKAVTSPKKSGWVADTLVVGEKTVAPNDKDSKITVTYNQGEQKGKVTYRNVTDEKAPKEIQVDALVGKSGEKSDYTTKDQLEKLYAAGYELKNDGFPKGGLTFDEDDEKDQDFNVDVVERISPITPENPGKPGEPLDPKYPDGAKWPEGTDEVTQKKERVIDYKFEGAEDKNHSEKDSRELTRSGQINHVTQKFEFKDWSDAEPFPEVKTPEETGWKPNKESVPEVKVNKDTPELTKQEVVYKREEVKPNKNTPIKELEPEKEMPAAPTKELKQAPNTGSGSLTWVDKLINFVVQRFN